MDGDLNRPNKINGFTGITEHTESKKQQRSRCEGFDGQIRTRHFAIMTLFFSKRWQRGFSGPRGTS